MAKLPLLLALAHSTLINGLPAPEKAHANAHEGRAITLSSDISVTTSYVSVISTLQSVIVTESPTITGVSHNPRFLFVYGVNIFTGHPNRPT